MTDKPDKSAKADKKDPRRAILYSANFVFICPNCHWEQLHTVGRTNSVYFCRSCEKNFTIDVSIRITDPDGKSHNSP